MPHSPDTRATLISRLPNPADADAWDRFVDIYEPLLYRLGRAKGFQDADAEEFVQEVLTAVAAAVGRWIDNDDRGPFRAWLFRIAQNTAVNFLTRRKHQRLGSGDSRVAQMLAQHPDPGNDSSALFLREYRRELFRWAAAEVKLRVTEKQWRAFWFTCVDDQPIETVASELAMSVGSVYVARSRVTKRIRDIIRRHEEQTR